MEVLEPFLKDDIDSYEKSVGIEMLKFMGKMGNVNLVFYEVPLPYIKYLVEVIRLSLPNTEFCYENANDSMAKSLDEGPKEKLLFEALAQEDLDEEDIFIE